MSPFLLTLSHDWSGPSPDRPAFVEIDNLTITMAAPFANDPAPETAAGPTPGLWNFEVLELFLGHNTDYLEVEAGPHGHHLVLRFRAVRTAFASALALDARFAHVADWWGVQFDVPHPWWPTAPVGVLGAHVFGCGSARRHITSARLPGEAPDFHQPEAWPALASCSRQTLEGPAREIKAKLAQAKGHRLL